MTYTDKDSERVRMAEHSSAGLETQQLRLPAGTGSGLGGFPTAAPQRRANPIALALIGVGSLMLLGRVATLPLDVEGGMVLLTIASCFYFFGFWKRIYGLIIPASLLAGLSSGITFADLTDGVSVMWGLALGFMLIYGLGSTMFNKRHSWPIIPAVILFAVGILGALANLPAFLGAGLIWLPLLLIGAGLYLGFMRRA